jgi:hypothetical protein
VFNVVAPSGEQIRYQVLRIAIPRRGRALPLLQLAYDRDDLPSTKSHNRLEQDALLAVVRALPAGVRPVILADRGFARATFFAWLQIHRLEYVVRIDKGTCLTEVDGQRWKLGEEGLRPGQLGWAFEVRYGLYHGRARRTLLNVALCVGRFRRAEQPIPGASSPKNPGSWPRVLAPPGARPLGTGKGGG